MKIYQPLGLVCDLLLLLVVWFFLGNLPFVIALVFVLISDEVIRRAAINQDFSFWKVLMWHSIAPFLLVIYLIYPLIFLGQSLAGFNAIFIPAFLILVAVSVLYPFLRTKIDKRGMA
jgi:hypothetical protein